MRRYYWSLVVCFIWPLAVVQCRLQRSAVGGSQRRPGLNPPGIALHLTNDGVWYLKNTVQKVLHKKLSEIHIAQVQNGSFLRVQFSLLDFQVVHLSSADNVLVELRAQSPNQLRLVVEHFDMTFKITIATSLRNLRHVLLYVSMGAASFSESIHLTVGRDGDALNISSTQCSLKIGSSHSDILEYDGRYGAANLVRNIFMKRLHLLMQENFCSRLSSFTEKSLSRIVGEIPIRQPLSDPPGGDEDHLLRNRTSKRSAERSKHGGGDPLQDFYMDFGLVFDPKVVVSPPIRYLLLPIKGEICNGHSTGAPPFTATRMNNPPGKRGVMLYIVITDYPINSLLYNMHTQGIFNYTFSSNDADEMGTFLRPTCDDLACLGFTVPALETDFAHHEIRCAFFASKAPRAQFDADGIVVRLQGHLSVWAVKWARATSLFDYDVVASVHPNMTLTEGRMVGRARVGHFQMRRSLSSTGDGGQLKLVDGHDELFGWMVRQMVERKLSDILRTGFKLPNSKVLKLKKPEMQMAKNAIWLISDVQLDENELQTLLTEPGLF